MSKKKILVLGATGQDGSTISKFLVKKILKFMVLLENQLQGI